MHFSPRNQAGRIIIFNSQVNLKSRDYHAVPIKYVTSMLPLLLVDLNEV